MSDILYKLTAKLTCDKEATAFLINENIAITARHAIENVLVNNDQIELEFFIDTNFKDNKVSAKVIESSEVLDIAILELNEAASHTSEWIELSNQSIEESDKWSCVGFPINWSTSKEGSNFCFLKGDIYQITKIDPVVYDVHLSSNYIKDDWEYDLAGLSGSPIVIDGKIKAVAIKEDSSLVKSAIKAISINKIADFLLENGIRINSTFGPKSNLINKRLVEQKTNFEHLFKKVDYQSEISDLNLQINSYYIKYNDRGEKRIDELAAYLLEMLINFANSLHDISSATSNTGANMFNLFMKTNEAISNIKKNKRLGSLLLWMITEGLLSAPKAFRRISLDNYNNIYNDVHIGISNDLKLILYLGEGKLNVDLKSAIFDILDVLNDIQNIEEDILTMDLYIYEQMDSNPLKKLIGDFNNPTERNWDNVTLELTVFTGYNSSFLNLLEKNQFTQDQIEKIISQKYINECLANEQLICNYLSEKPNLKEIKINWFNLPFNTIEEFEELILSDLSKVGIG